MDLKIVKKHKNELMKRTEITAEMQEKTIPSKQQIREKLAALVNSSVEKISITKVVTKFGSPAAIVHARTYNSVEDLKKTEQKYVVVRNFGKEKKEGSEADANAPASFKK
ncbi:MAG: 30S ribosomal protein S24e [archaeon]|jgi:small subunit ribosomal protein S24e